MHLISINTFQVGGKFAPRKFIWAAFRTRGASTPAADLVVVVNHTRSGQGDMRIKGKTPKERLSFKQDGSRFQSTTFLFRTGEAPHNFKFRPHEGNIVCVQPD